MAARSDAAATPGPNDGAFMSFNVVRSSPNIVSVPLKHRESTPRQIYDRQSLLEIGNAHKHQLSPAAIEKLRGLCILLKPDLETVASPSDAIRTKRRRRRCERGRKRGKRGGIRARLRANPTRPALPTLMLSNVRSLENKLDEIQLSRSTEQEARDCCVFVFTETWLNDKTPDSAIQLHGLTCCRADRELSLSGKTRGGGLCVYINKEWCNNAAVVTKNCSSLVEFMFVKCRPFYLPREFTAIVIVAVYIPPCANPKDALRELYSAISEQQTNNPDGFFIIAGDFNHANLKSVLPKFYQHVNFATRGNNTLDFVYTTNKNAYRAEPRPHLGYSDHISVMLIPAYRPLLKLTKPVQKQITVWPDNATSALQDCFQNTDWNMFKEAATYNNQTDLQEYTETVTAYIKKCIDDVTVTKTITTRANQKPWMTAEVRRLLKIRDEAFRSGDRAALKTARANLSHGIKKAKHQYAQKINNNFSDSKDTRSLWQAIQTITDYKPLPQASDDDTSLPDALNHFYSRFEIQNNTPAQKLHTSPNDQMAARSDAAATPGPNDGAFMSFNVVRSSPNIVSVPLKHRESTPRQIYDRQSLLEIGNAHKHQLSPAAIEKLRGLCILLKPDLETVASPSDAIRTKRRRRRCERGRKRGKRGGIRARLRANPTRPALPTLMLSNVRSLENKLDEIQLSRSTEHEARDCCVFVFTETWLNDKTPDSAIQLHGLTCCRADRDSSLSGKTRGGGLCVYINKEWCNNAAVVTKNCSSLVEFMFVKCRPFYLPREFTAIVIVAVYIPPCANPKDALRELYSAISEQQTNNPDGFFIIAAYRPLLKLTKPVQKQITVWPDNATSALQDCFQNTDWNMFKEAATYNNQTDLQEYTETVTAYIKKCIDDVTVTKTITTRANQKPWMTAEVRRLLKIRDEAFRSGDRAALKTARANLSHGIKKAKHQYAQKINNNFSDSKDTRSLWQAIQTITDYKPLPQASDDDTSLPDALNHFYSRFEIQNNTPAQKLHTSPNDQVLCLSAADVRKTLSRINPRKAAGPDNIPGRVLRECAAQLTDVLTDIFNTSLSQAVVPTCLKSTSIIPVPKKSPVSCLNDYRPIALTPIMMKCFERLVMHHIKSSLPNTLDPFQFAYRPNRSTDDAISSTLHLALTHLEHKDSYVRMLFIDFSSAFNTIIPQQLIHKLNLLGLNTSLCNWILDFLTGRPQSVRVGSNTSSTTTLSTGAPQGCVLSPLLFTLLTHDCTAKFSSNHIIKFADDTTVVGLISNNDETHYREEVAQLAKWCGANNLSLNVSKTKEVVMDFRRNSVDHRPLTIDSSAVERVSSTKFLGVHITENLTWTTNVTSLNKKGQQRLHFLRRLKRASLPPPILTTFYRGTIESVLTSYITVWYGNCSAADRKTLQRTVNTAAKIIGAPLPSILDIFLARCSSKASSIVKDPSHPSHNLFQLLPSGR
ncbi:hypothetical protein M9458_017187, partial [Cirrhinus mrigala]